jgi:DNA-binding response OmpR family regulator
VTIVEIQRTPTLWPPDPVLSSALWPSQRRGVAEADPGVLVVDDDEDVRMLLRGVLEPEGFDVFLAESGGVALPVALTLQPRAVVVDWILPDCSGLEVCAALRAQLPQTRILVITGRQRRGDADVVRAAGADRFMLKPLSPKAVTACLRHLTDPER